MSEFVHLHGHTTFSFLDGYGTPRQVAERLRELGHTTAAITDHGNVYGHVPYQTAFRKAGLKPIFGCEFYVVDDMTARERGAESVGADSAPHVTVIASNERGYRNLLNLIRMSNDEGFYYKPRVDWNAIAQKQDGLVVLSGCLGGYPSRIFKTRGYQALCEFLQQQRERIQQFYIELIPEPGIEMSDLCTHALVCAACELKIPMVMTSDAHFPRGVDHDVQDIMFAVGMRRKVSDPDRLKLMPYQFYDSREELLQRARDLKTQVPEYIFENALDNTGLIAQGIDIEIPHAERLAFPGIGRPAREELWAWVQQGFKERYEGGEFPTELAQVYSERAQREFRVLDSKGFCDYMLVIIDVVRHVKNLGGLVMCRGSAGGCLLLWLTGASETDPMKHGLSFERFYDDNRPDPPDVDIDFERAWRDRAIEYVYDKYGHENCSQIANLSQLRARAALQDAAFALGVPRPEYEALSKALTPADEELDVALSTIKDQDALNVLKKYPKLAIFEKMIGQYRQTGVHAAGVIIASKPLEDVIGVIRKQGKTVAAIDKYGAANLGFLKMDFLAVNGLDVISSTLRLAGMKPKDLSRIPLNDENALKLAHEGVLTGIFQLDGGSAARVCSQIKVSTFDDLVAASALCRPGPGGWVETYQANKEKYEKTGQHPTYSYHPVVQDIVSETFGILLYQEQVMRFAREIGMFEWKDVHRLRKAITSSAGSEEIDRYATMFFLGAQTNGLQKEEIQYWWDAIRTHGSYSFNKAHCVTYGIIGYWMLWLKAHYPQEFYEGYLQNETDEWMCKRLIREFMAWGGRVIPLDPVHSRQMFTRPEPWVLVGGYMNITGVGQKTADKIVDEGPYSDWDDFFRRCRPALSKSLQETGIHTDNVDMQKLIAVMPWVPVHKMGNEELVFRATTIGTTSRSLVPDIPRGDTKVCGYVTYASFDNERIKLIVEDEQGQVFARVAMRLVSRLIHKFRNVKVADFVVIYGDWNGETFFAKDISIIKEGKKHDSPASKTKRTKDASGDRASIV